MELLKLKIRSQEAEEEDGEQPPQVAMETVAFVGPRAVWLGIKLLRIPDSSAEPQEMVPLCHMRAAQALLNGHRQRSPIFSGIHFALNVFRNKCNNKDSS